MPNSRILIVGGGIGGLALGRALREQGFAPEIVERASSWTAPGTGLYLPASGVRALETLGLLDKLLGRAVRITHQRLFNHRGRRLAEIDLAKVWRTVGPCVGITRMEVHRVLLEGCSGVSIPVPCILSQLGSFDPIHFSPIEEVAVHTWGRGRVVLIGDAAHATSPNRRERVAALALPDVSSSPARVALGWRPCSGPGRAASRRSPTTIRPGGGIDATPHVSELRREL